MDSMNRLLQIMQMLRHPEKGCPWDREQDFFSIAPYTIEEAYEVADAIERQDMEELRHELGDLLFQVVYHAQLASEQGHFAFAEVVNSINAKLLDRHPHVFGDITITNAREQSRAWEAIKTRERLEGNAGEPAGILDGVPLNQPALMRAQKLQSRAAGVGFDWPDVKGVLDKVEEELQELRAEIAGDEDKARMREELGDLLFACVNLARHLDTDAEGALRAANHKFEDRFRYVEACLRIANKSPADVTLEEMENLWQEAKTRQS